jgi:uncharacterized protein YkwD
MIDRMGWLLLLLLATCGPPMYGPSSQPPAPPPPDPSAPPPASPPSSPSTSPSPSPSSSSAKPRSNSLADRFVAAHNAARAKHCAGPLTWSPKLADYAQRWADTLKAKGCAFGHSPGMTYGENLAAGTQGLLDPEGTVEYWYSEIKQYKFPNGGFSMDTGHFTQLVWRDTTQVGCGHAVCNGNDLWVCEYSPPGNVEGEYRDQVRAPGCR